MLAQPHTETERDNPEANPGRPVQVETSEGWPVSESAGPAGYRILDANARPPRAATPAAPPRIPRMPKSRKRKAEPDPEAARRLLEQILGQETVLGIEKTDAWVLQWLSRADIRPASDPTERAAFVQRRPFRFPQRVSVRKHEVIASRMMRPEEAAKILVALAVAQGFTSVRLEGSARFQAVAQQLLQEAGVEVISDRNPPESDAPESRAPSADAGGNPEPANDAPGAPEAKPDGTRPSGEAQAPARREPDGEGTAEPAFDF